MSPAAAARRSRPCSASSVSATTARQGWWSRWRRQVSCPPCPRAAHEMCSRRRPLIYKRTCSTVVLTKVRTQRRIDVCHDTGAERSLGRQQNARTVLFFRFRCLADKRKDHHRRHELNNGDGGQALAILSGCGLQITQ